MRVKRKPRRKARRGPTGAPTGKTMNGFPIRVFKVKDLVPAPYNPRRISEHALSGLRASVDKFGLVAPIIWNKNTQHLVGGHQRLKTLDPDSTTEVTVVDLNAVEEKALNVVLNSSNIQGEWTGNLGEILSEIEAQLPGLAEDILLGDLAEDFEDMNFPGEEPGEEPGADEPPEDPVSERGVIYTLGVHRLFCGDATSAEDVAALLGGEQPRLMVTDPPYGVGLDQGWRDRIEGCIRLGKAQADKIAGDEIVDWSQAWDLFKGDVAYVWHAYKHASAVENSLAGVGLLVRQQLIWVKQQIVVGRGAWQSQHESCWYLVRKGKTAGWKGARDQSTIFQVASPKQIMSANTEEKHDHPTQKPLECMERPIRNHCGDVYDPFVGSGTSLIAAARQGRRSFCMEISPAYTDVVRKRWGGYCRANDLDPGPDAL